MAGIDPKVNGRDRVLAQIEAWRKELVNLARSNRLLNFRDTRSSTLGIVAAPHEVGGIVGHLLAGKSWEFFAPPDPDGEDESSAAALIPRPGELITDKNDRAALTSYLAQPRPTSDAGVHGQGSLDPVPRRRPPEVGRP